MSLWKIFSHDLGSFLKDFASNTDIYIVGCVVPLPIAIYPICLKGRACCGRLFATGFFCKNLFWRVVFVLLTIADKALDKFSLYIVGL